MVHLTGVLGFRDFRVSHHSVFFLLLIQASADGYGLVGPSRPIVAIAGDDIILPCQVEHAMDVLKWMVKWARPDLSPEYVYVYQYDNVDVYQNDSWSVNQYDNVDLNQNDSWSVNQYDDVDFNQYDDVDVKQYDRVEIEIHPSYKGRTSLSIDKLEVGDVSLKISKVKHSDEGRYECFTGRMPITYIDLVVADVNMAPAGLPLQWIIVLETH
uniref:Immunoglobulin domain-containing protein n=1 Tax=Dicentrarchus labrax TaxID=13489 RepID=A0A8P4GI47_DICLA